MINKNDILQYLKENKELFTKQYNVIRIGIFGSFARNEQTENSDIDILISMDENTEDIFDKRIALKQLISHHFSKPVDVCHEKSLKSVFKEHIIKEVIYVK